MSIKQINEGFKSRFENVLMESCTPSDKDELRAALEDAAFNLSSRQIMNLKAYEIAFQDAIEKLYPDNAWWEITDCNIFWDLFENRDIYHTINEIINQLKCDEGTVDEAMMMPSGSDKEVKIATNDKGDYLVYKKGLGYSAFNKNEVSLGGFDEIKDNTGKVDHEAAKKKFLSGNFNESKSTKENIIGALKEDLDLKIIEEERVYLPTPDGKADIHVMLTCESFEDEVEYGIDIYWGSAAKLAYKISKAIWKYSYGDDRYIHIGENNVEIPQKGFVESRCCWGDEDLDVIQELYDAVIEGLMNIDVPEDLEEAARKKFLSGKFNESLAESNDCTGCDATLLPTVKNYLTTAEFKDIRHYVNSDCTITGYDSYGRLDLEFSDGKVLSSIPKEYVKVHRDSDESLKESGFGSIDDILDRLGGPINFRRALKRVINAYPGIEDDIEEVTDMLYSNYEDDVSMEELESAIEYIISDVMNESKSVKRHAAGATKGRDAAQARIDKRSKRN